MDPVRLGVIGLGGRGRYFARCYDQHPEAELVAVADPNPAALARLKPAYADRIDYYEDLDTFLERDDIEAVVIATPDHAHRDNAVQTFGYGKHVLLEKPMAQSIEDTDDILRAWNEAGTVLTVGLELRYCAIFVRMWEILNEGLIGDIKMGAAVDNVSVGGDYFYHDQQRTKSYTVSLLMQKGVHTIDLLNWFMGGTPTKVYATGTPTTSTNGARGRLAADTAAATHASSRRSWTGCATKHEGPTGESQHEHGRPTLVAAGTRRHHHVPARRAFPRRLG